jgi:hypothetical protein
VATFTEAGETWDTNAGNKTVVATPSSGDLIVVAAGASGMAGADDIVISDNNSDGLGTYVRIARSAGGGTTGMMDLWVRNALIGSATSTTFTATITGDTGGGLTVMRLSGMYHTGYGAVRQSAQESTQTEDPPSIAFSYATLTGNPIIIGVLCEDNPAALTSPTGFTETTDTGWNSPATGIHVCFVDSGQTNSTYTYQAGGAATDHNEVAVELDASAFSATTHGPAARLQLIRNSGMIGLRRR